MFPVVGKWRVQRSVAWLIVVEGWTVSSDLKGTAMFSGMHLLLEKINQQILSYVFQNPKQRRLS